MTDICRFQKPRRQSGAFLRLAAADNTQIKVCYVFYAMDVQGNQRILLVRRWRREHASENGNFRICWG